MLELLLLKKSLQNKIVNAGLWKMILQSIQSVDEIPLGHKIAMVDLKEGDTILNMVMILVKWLNQLKKVNMFMFTM